MLGRAPRGPPAGLLLPRSGRSQRIWGAFPLNVCLAVSGDCPSQAGECMWKPLTGGRRGESQREKI